MEEPTATRDLPPLSFRASFKPGSVNMEKRTVDLVWTTGARVLRGYFERYWEELSLDAKHVRMGRLNNGAPFLRDHGDTSFMGGGALIEHVMGVVESATLSPTEGTATIRFAKAEDDPEADRVLRKIADGIIQNVSVAYRVYKMQKVEDGETEIPVYRAVDWEPYEISAVAMGADDGAGFRSAGGNKGRQPDTNTCEFIRGEAPHKEQSKEQSMAEKQTNDPKASETEAARSAEAIAAEAIAAEGATKERERGMAIRKLIQRAGLEMAMADKMVADNVSVDKAREMVLEELATRSEKTPTRGEQRVEAGEDEQDKRRRGQQAWLIERSGMGDIIREAKKHPRLGERFAQVSLDGGEFRGMSLLEIARDYLERGGVRTNGMDRMTLAGRAFTHRTGSMQTTSDFAVLLETTMHKMLLGAYAVTPDTWSRFCRRDTVPDFRPSNRYRLGSFGSLDTLNEHGEFKRKVAPDGVGFEIETETKGNTVAITRKTIVNDDMGALADLAKAFGRAGGLTLEKEVYALLAENSGLGPTMGDSNPFFHATRANVNATGSALSVAGLDADRVVMGSQKDPSNNEYLSIRPAVLVVPLGLGGDARVINDAQYDTATSKLNVPNKVRGLFRDIVDTPRLSSTRRYLFADPNDVATIVVAFLEGQDEAPVLESRAGWDVDGTEWKVRLDALAQVFDPKGAVTNAGG